MQEREIEKVQILPWTHDLFAQKHQELIQQIKAIPKNSVLFIEESPLGIDFLAGLPQAARRNEFKGYYPRESRLLVKNLKPKLAAQKDYNYLNMLLSGGLATVDVIEEARRRNLKLIALETTTSRLAMGRAMRDIISTGLSEHYLEFTCDSFRREGVFARQINNAIKSLKGKKVFVLCGASHVPGLADELAKTGVAFEINTRSFSEGSRREFFQTFKVNEKARAFYKQKDMGALGRMLPLIYGEHSYKLSPLQPEELVAALKKRLDEGNFKPRWDHKNKTLRKLKVRNHK